MKNFSLLLVLFAFACGDDDGRGNTDAGTDSAVRFDTGGAADAPTFDSGIVLADSGTDTGAMGTDSGMARMCRGIAPPTAIPDGMLPRCAAGTLTCLMACTDQTCFDGCIAADTTPPAGMLDCNTCVQSQIGACWYGNGCDDEFNLINCCVEDNSCMDQACVNANCGGQVSGFQDCGGALDNAVCQPMFQECFAPAG